jgi:hypothetical protein
MTWTTDSATAAELAAALASNPDKIKQLSAIATALGTGPRTLTIKRADAGDPWAGTTVYVATLSGPNVIAENRIKPGQVVSQSEASGGDLSTGVAVLRVSNAAGRYIQAPIVTGESMSGFSIPRDPAGLFGFLLGDSFGFAASVDLPEPTSDSRPIFFVGPASAYMTNTQVLMNAGTRFGSSGSRAGVALVQTPTVEAQPGIYGWIAVAASVSASGVTFTDASGTPGDWNGAGLPGQNGGASPVPATSSVLFTHSNGVSMRLFRMDNFNSQPTPSNWTLS